MEAYPPGRRHRRLIKNCAVMSTFHDVDFGYTDDKHRAPRYDTVCKAGTEDCICRFHRCRKNDDHQPDQPFLRYVRMERSGMTASISTRSRKRICAGLLVSYFRIRTCLPERSWKISATESWMRPTRKFIAAAKLANADGFIRRLPDGYDTMLTGDGGRLIPGAASAAFHRPCGRSQIRRF